MIAEWFYYFGGLADKLHGETIPLGADLQIYTLRQPVGVVGTILPWNAPALMFSSKSRRPSLRATRWSSTRPSCTSITALALARLLQEEAFPNGVVNVLPAMAYPAGNALASHLDVDKVAFTRERSTARRISEASVANLKRLSFELGGKAANIGVDDADYDQAAFGRARGRRSSPPARVAPPVRGSSSSGHL